MEEDLLDLYLLWPISKLRYCVYVSRFTVDMIYHSIKFNYVLILCSAYSAVSVWSVAPGASWSKNWWWHETCFQTKGTKFSDFAV